MQTFNDFKNQAELLRKQGKYSAAIKAYEELSHLYPDNFDNFVYWGYAFCLRKASDIKKAFIIAQKNYLNQIKQENYLKNKTYEINAGLYAWCHYDLFINVKKVDNNEKFLKAANKIIKLTNQSDNRSPFVLTVFKVIDHLKNNNLNSDKILEWLNKLDSNNLNDQPRTWTLENSKTIKICSDRCKFFQLKCKALLELKKYQDCINAGEQAIKELENDNNVWIKYSIAQAYYEQGNVDESFNLINEIYQIEKKWFIQHWLMKIYIKQNNYNKAVKYAADACLNNGDDEMKTKLYYDIVRLLKENNEIDKAKKFVEYICVLKRENSYKIDKDLLQYVKLFDISIGTLKNSRDIKKEIIEICENLKFKSETRFNGRIKKILPNGKSGFIEIESDDKKSYYFNFRSFIGPKSFIKIGQAVSFYLQDSFDKKRDTSSKEAINIKIINSN